jgi:hypothetical protein
VDLVDQVLKEWRQSSYDLGERDCILSLADYVRRATGQDHAQGRAGSYVSESEAYALIDRLGGIEAIIDATGLPVGDVPERGDVVLLDCMGALLPALCTGEGAVARRDRGTAEVSLRFVKLLKVWKVHHGRS